MTNRENLILALDGKKPEYIPLTVNEDFTSEDPCWDQLYEQGLCPIPYTAVFKENATNIERVVKKEYYNGKNIERIVLKTSVGNITQISSNGWVQEHFLKDPKDYRVMEYVIRDTKISPNYSSFHEAEEKLGNKGISLIGIGRTPLQTIMVDFVGVENFALHLADELPELFGLQEALMDTLVEICRITAEGPGRYVSLLENFTAEIWGPQRFAKYHKPAYEKILPILHAGGKKVCTHFDGKLECVSKLLAQTDMDCIESLTSPPEGDMTYAKARETFGDKVFWANINVSYYDLPKDLLKKKVHDLRQAASLDGHNLAFEISEELPANWRESIPIVLQALRDC